MWLREGAGLAKDTQQMPELLDNPPQVLAASSQNPERQEAKAGIGEPVCPRPHPAETVSKEKLGQRDGSVV